MAGSRADKIGTIFTRLTGLIRSGAIKEEDRPLWYDVYKAFPPTHEPCYTRVPPPREIPNIFYPEDVIRAKFYKKYPYAVNNMLSDNVPLSERFVEKYQEIEKEGNVEDVFAATEAALKLNVPVVVTEQTALNEDSSELPDEQRMPKIEFKLSNIFEVKTKKDSSSNS